MAREDLGGNGGHAVTEGAHFCAECGAGLTGGKFCANCGHPVETTPFPRHEQAVERGADFANGNSHATRSLGEQPLLDDVEATQRMAPPAEVPPVSTASAPKRRWPILAGVGVLALAAIAVALIFLLGGSSKGNKGNVAAAYNQQVAAAYKPVDQANQKLSNALNALDAGSPTRAKAAVAQAQRATSSARGALGAITVPAGSDQLNSQMRQALDREDTYLSAVNLALSDPSSPSVSQAQSLEGNVTSALEAVGAPIAGSAQNVDGADNLTQWAQRSVRKARAKARRKRQQAATQAATPTPATPGASGATSNCVGTDISVDASTTRCDFAENVRADWTSMPDINTPVDSWSPSLGRDIAMDCAQTGDAITCTGGNNAFVSWPWP